MLPLSACAQQRLVFRGDVLLELDGQKLADDGTFAVGQQERRCLQRPHPHLHPSPQPNPHPSPHPSPHPHPSSHPHPRPTPTPSITFTPHPPSSAWQERLSFQHLIHLKFAGEPVKLRLLREGEELLVDVPVYPQARLVPSNPNPNPKPIPKPKPTPKPTPKPYPQARLVPSHIYDEPQSYFIYGGLAFVALTEPYLHEWGDEWMSDAPHELVNLVMAGIALLPDEQPVSRPYSK